MNAVYVLWLRQLKRYVRSKARIVGALGQPMLYLLGFGLGFGPIFQKAGQGDYIQFLAPGVIGMSILFTALFSGIDLIWDRQFGFLKETLVAPVPRLMIMVGRTVAGATVAMFQGIIVVVISLLVGFRPVSWTAWPLGFVYMALIAVMFTALGTAIASVLEDFQGFQLVMSLLVMPIFFLSGALFPLRDTIPAMKLIASFDPLSYGVDGLRGALSGGGYYFGATTDLVVMSALTAALLAAGSYLFSRLQL